MNNFEHIQKTFALSHLPMNIRASKFMARLPFIRRYQRLPVGLKFLPAGGSFVYERGQRCHTVKFNGRNLQFHALYDDHFRYGYELETSLLVSALCRGAAAFLDIGSNWGYYSLLAASLPEFSGSIYAVEPNPRTYADLTSTIAQAAVANRVTPCHFGLGSTVCEMVVAEADRFNTGLSRLAPKGGGQKIPVKTVDSLDFGPFGFVKIDAEGMELDILTGASNTLAKARPFVVLENFVDFEEPAKTYATIEFLREINYRVFLPVLEFSVGSHKFLATYGRDYTPIVEHSGPPQLGVIEVNPRLRFLLGDHLNLLGVHEARIEDLWKAGILNIGGV